MCKESEVINIFCEHIVKKSLEKGLLNKYPKLQNFIDYMIETWLEGNETSIYPGPLFKISWWNHWYHMETRTNNTNEAYNFRIIVKLGSKIHPNIWIWVEFIQVEDCQMSIKFESIRIGNYKGRS